MNTKTPLSFAILSDFSIHTDEDGLLHILPFGQFRANDGRPFDAPYWAIYDVEGEYLAAQLNTRSKDLVIDYEHQTLYVQKNGQPAPASGWLKAGSYVWKSGQGLFARVDWTQKAQNFIDNKEYRFLSPVFTYDKTGAIHQFAHLALTNTPALDNLPEVMAALSQTFSPMESKSMEAIKLLKQLLGLSESADDAQTTAALNAVINQVTENKGLAACNTTLGQFINDKQTQIVALSAAEPDPAKYVPVDTMTGLQTQVAALSGQLKAIETEKATALIQVALSDGRLLPAQKSWAENLAKTNLAALSEFLNTAQGVAALSQSQTGGQPPAGVEDKKGMLTDVQLAVCAQLGLSPEDYKKAMEA